MRSVFALALIAGAFSVPASACMSVAPSVRAWVQCSYAVAYECGDHRLMVSMAKAKVLDKKVKPTSERRWDDIHSRIEKKYRTFADAQDKDAGKDRGSNYIPQTKFMAIFDISDRDKMVKS